MSVPPPPRPRSPLRQLGFIDRPIANRVDDEYSIIRLGTRRKAKKKRKNTYDVSDFYIGNVWRGWGWPLRDWWRSANEIAGGTKADDAGQSFHRLHYSRQCHRIEAEREREIRRHE